MRTYYHHILLVIELRLKLKLFSRKQAGLRLQGKFLRKFGTSIEHKFQGIKLYEEQSADDLQKELTIVVASTAKELRLLNKS